MQMVISGKDAVVIWENTAPIIDMREVLDTAGLLSEVWKKLRYG